MNNLSQALWVETLKARRSKMPLMTTLGFLLLPLVWGFFMIVLKDPEFARRVGLISAKAELLGGTADWPAFFSLQAQGMAGGGIILFGFVVTWVFGREFADRTAKEWLALPTSRTTIVVAKFVIVLGWSAALTAVTLLAGLVVGALVGLPQFSMATLWHGLTSTAVSAVLVALLTTPFAFAASAGRGYLPALGAVILAIMLAQVAAIAGWGDYFPWAIPALAAQGSRIGPGSLLIVLLTSIAGVAATILWWERADQAT